MEDHAKYQQSNGDTEVTLADIILTVQAYIRHLIQKWYWILIVMIIGVLIAVAIVKLQTIKHIAEITFVANEESQRGGNSILASTLASFGLSSEDDGETSRYSKIIALSQSRKIQFAALLDSVFLDGNKDLLANHISRIYDLQNEWKVNEPVHFMNQSPDNMELTHKQYLKRIYAMITSGKHPLFTITFDNTSQMIIMTAETVHPDLSIVLVQLIYENLNQFYVTQSTSKGQETVKTLTFRKDSLETVLRKQQSQLASARDRSLGMTYQAQQTNRLDLSVDVDITKAMYMEVVKNLEFSRFNLENIRQVFTIIDFPFKPLSTDRKNLIQYMAIFAMVGAVFATMFFILQKMYSDIMKGADE